MKKLLKIAVAVFLTGVTSFGQSKVDERIMPILKRSLLVYQKKEGVHIETTYSLFENHKSIKTLEQYKSVVLKKGKTSYNRLPDMELFISEKTSLTIDHEERNILVSSSNENPPDPYSTEQLLKALKFFPKQTLKEVDGTWICTFETEKVTLSQYSKVVFYIKKSSYEITKQVLYFLRQFEHFDSKKQPIYTNPRLEITFKSQPLTAKEAAQFLDVNTFVTTKQGRMYPAKKFKDYTIIN